jgi:glycosyltransferase involved in cell wall biosynthesis
LLLTIGVPVSNQIGAIRRCLEGIRPLLEQLPAELVVVDTGSTDGTVEVCREYGARVIDFPWIDDMSAARNQAIRAARGLWYMSIDDDEWFEDAEPFLEFFRSGLYADYDYASYPQRNYSDLAMKRWSDFPTARIARMRPDLHFHGRIHDCYASVILNNKVYYIRAAAHHVGFVYADSWVMRRKMARNIQGLRRDMAQYPADLRFSFHLSREMGFIREYKQALRLAYWVMSMDRGASTAIAGGWRQLTVGMLLISLPNGGWNEQALLLAERWLSLEDYNDISRCALLAVLASVRTRLGDHKGSVECGLRYLELRGELLSLPVRERDLMMNEFMIDSVHERIFRGVLRQMIENYWRLRDFAAADMLIACGDMAELLLEEDLYREKTLTYLYRNRRWPVWQALLTRYRSAGRLDGVDMLLAALAEWSQADDYGEALRLVRASGLKSFGFMAFMDLRLCAEAGAATASGYRQAREFAAGLEGEARYRCQFTLLREVFRLGLDPAPAVAAMDIPATEYLFARLEAETDGPRALWERLLAWHTDIGAEAGVMERYLAMRVSEILFIKLGKSAQLNTDILQTYMERRWQWESALYAPGLLGGGDERLPPWLRAVCQTREALRLWREERDYPAALRAVKSAALLSGVFKETAEKLARLITADYEKEREEGGLAAAANRAEFAALLESVKSEARQLRARGETETAARILTKLAELAPGDAEIGALLSALSADKE